MFLQKIENPKFEFNPQIAVFLNVVQQIIKLNRRFLKDVKSTQNLSESRAQETQVAEVFLHYSKLFVIYGTSTALLKLMGEAKTLIVVVIRECGCDGKT